MLSDAGSHSRASVNYKGHCNKKVMGNLGQTLTCTGVEVDWRWRRLLGRLEIDKEVGEETGVERARGTSCSPFRWRRSGLSSTTSREE